MAPNDNRPVKPSGGFIGELTLRIKLILRLMGDRRVSPFLKVIPVGTVLYLVIPDLVIGPLDDAAVIGLGMGLFVELCPQYVVDEHMRLLRSVPTASNPNHMPHQKEEDVLEGEFREADDPQTIKHNDQ